MMIANSFRDVKEKTKDNIWTTFWYKEFRLTKSKENINGNFTLR